MEGLSAVGRRVWEQQSGLRPPPAAHHRGSASVKHKLPEAPPSYRRMFKRFPFHTRVANTLEILKKTNNNSASNIQHKQTPPTNPGNC